MSRLSVGHLVFLTPQHPRISKSAAIVTFAAGWAVSGTQAQVAAPSVQIEALKIMTSAKLPTDQFTDYSVIFN
jgi:hypothetical protein